MVVDVVVVDVEGRDRAVSASHPYRLPYEYSTVISSHEYFHPATHFSTKLDILNFSKNIIRTTNQDVHDQHNVTDTTLNSTMAISKLPAHC